MIAITLDDREHETIRVALRHLITASLVGDLPGDYEVTARTILDRLKVQRVAG